MPPGKVCWIVDVAICAGDDFELGNNPKKRPRPYLARSDLLGAIMLKTKAAA